MLARPTFGSAASTAPSSPPMRASAAIAAAQLDIAERADRARDEDVAPGDLARLAGDAHRGGVDLLELFGKELPRQLRPICAEAVRLDQLGSGPDISEVYFQYALGRAE